MSKPLNCCRCDQPWYAAGGSAITQAVILVYLQLRVHSHVEQNSRCSVLRSARATTAAAKPVATLICFMTSLLLLCCCSAGPLTRARRHCKQPRHPSHCLSHVLLHHGRAGLCPGVAVWSVPATGDTANCLRETLSPTACPGQSHTATQALPLLDAGLAAAFYLLLSSSLYACLSRHL